MLVLPIKKEWLNMIISGEKKEEYREIKPYYDGIFKKYMPRVKNFKSDCEYIASSFFIVFRNGYNYNDPSIKCRCSLEIRKGKEKWGAKPNKRYYVLRILEILEVQNVN